MLSRLLNALFGWLAKPVAGTSAQEAVSEPNLPDHGRNGRQSSPPQHWLDAVRNAGPRRRGGSDELGETIEPSPVAKEPVRETQTEPEGSVSAKWQTPVENVAGEEVRFDQSRNTPAPEMKFSVEQESAPSEAMHWTKARRHEQKSILARFWSWLTDPQLLKPVPLAGEIPTENPKSQPSRVLEFEKKSGSKETRQHWDSSVQRHRTPVLNFPRPEDRQRVRESHYPDGNRGARGRNVQWAQETKKPASWVEFPENHTPLTSTGRYSSAVAKQDTEIAPTPSPMYWPDLAPSDTPEAASFQAQDRDEMKVDNKIESHANVWPELLQTQAGDGFLWRSVMREFARSQRLEKEQRGY